MLLPHISEYRSFLLHKPSLPKTPPGTPRNKALPANLGPGKLTQINHQIPYQLRPSHSRSTTVSSHPFGYYQGLQELKPQDKPGPPTAPSPQVTFPNGVPYWVDFLGPVHYWDSKQRCETRRRVQRSQRTAPDTKRSVI